MRYCFDLKWLSTWKDMKYKWFWNMWGVKDTLRFMIKDTLRNNSQLKMRS